ncbi:uncharacterized protein JCM6883_002724 [Sporobolomyces salmoneus]|uniref:uncharacterized protein n=1 Tax=Sporobolomyces salmoneus TaxID=183962 RepID=UPI0031707BCD
MSYQTFTDCPQTTEFLETVPPVLQQQRRRAPSPLACFLQTTSIFLVLFLIALAASLIVDKSVPKQFLATQSTTHRGSHGLESRVLQLERRMMELEKRAEIQNWRKLMEDDDKED